MSFTPPIRRMAWSTGNEAALVSHAQPVTAVVCLRRRLTLFAVVILRSIASSVIIQSPDHGGLFWRICYCPDVRWEYSYAIVLSADPVALTIATDIQGKINSLSTSRIKKIRI